MAILLADLLGGVYCILVSARPLRNLALSLLDHSMFSFRFSSMALLVLEESLVELSWERRCGR